MDAISFLSRGKYLALMPVRKRSNMFLTIPVNSGMAPATFGVAWMKRPDIFYDLAFESAFFVSQKLSYRQGTQTE